MKKTIEVETISATELDKNKMTLLVMVSDGGRSFLIQQWGQKRQAVMLPRKTFEDLAKAAGVKVEFP